MKTLHIFFSLILLLVAGCATVSSNEAPFNIQAHRGAGLARPENTLESFKWSWASEGITPEADLRTTKDGIIVCFHDKNFKRVTVNLDEKMKKQGVEDISFAEAGKLDVGSFRGNRFSGHRIPALTEVFESMQEHPERMIYLDIKEMKTEDYEKLANLIKKYGVTDQAIFTTRIIYITRLLAPLALPYLPSSWRRLRRRFPYRSPGCGWLHLYRRNPHRRTDYAECRQRRARHFTGTGR